MTQNEKKNIPSLINLDLNGDDERVNKTALILNFLMWTEHLAESGHENPWNVKRVNNPIQPFLKKNLHTGIVDAFTFFVFRENKKNGF